MSWFKDKLEVYSGGEVPLSKEERRNPFISAVRDLEDFTAVTIALPGEGKPLIEEEENGSTISNTDIPQRP